MYYKYMESTMTLTINSKFFKAAMEEDERGYAPSGYVGYTTEPGKHVATIEGDFQLADPKMHFGVTMIVLDGGTWAMRDVLAMAKRGERGLKVVR